MRRRCRLAKLPLRERAEPGPSMNTADENPIPLKQAAEQFGFTVSTLRAEAKRGRLNIYRIGNKLYTTPADVRRMVVSCRIVPKGQDLVLTRDDGATKADGVAANRADLSEILSMLENMGPK